MAAIAPFSEDFVAKMRSIRGAHWNPKALRWEFPERSCNEFRAAFVGWLLLAADTVAEERLEKSPSTPPRVSAAMTDAMRSLKYSRRTMKRYLAIVERYARFIERPLLQADNEDATRFLAHLERDRGSSASTINQAISAIRFLYGRILGRDAQLARRPKCDRRLPDILSREEALRIIASPRNLKHQVLLALAYSAGLRVSEISELHVSDVDPSRGVILVRQGKGRKDRYTILAERTKHLLKVYIQLYHPKLWLFEGKDGGHLTVRSIQEVFYKAKEKMRIDKNVSIHSLRHSFATHLLENGTDIRYIQELLGHSNPKTTQIYTHIAKRDFLRIRSPYDRSVDSDADHGAGDDASDI
jgi:site-specific recombinase XerD